jgi:NAD(P)-dependent dehydrogenase (short-subunit alcohol dehydrogenase family)
MATSKIVLVTGDNNGIGYETIKAFLESKRPYRILMGSRSVEKAERAVEKLQKEVPDTTNTVEILQLDLVSDESINAAFEHVKSKFGYIDALINNAGNVTPNIHLIVTVKL